MSRTSDLRARVERIERHLAGQAECVRTKKVLILDSAGNARCMLGCKDGLPVLHLQGQTDVNGKGACAVLSIRDGEPELSLQDSDGQSAVRVAVKPWRGVQVQDRKAGAGSVARLGVGPLGDAALVLCGRGGLVQGVLRAKPGGPATLRLNDARQKLLFAAPAATESQKAKDATAVADYKRSLKANGRNPTYHVGYAVLLTKLGRNQEARAHLRRAMDLYPAGDARRQGIRKMLRSLGGKAT